MNMYVLNEEAKDLRIITSYDNWSPRKHMHRKKRLATFPSQAHSPFPARESLESDIPAGDGNVANLFYSVAKPLDSPDIVKINLMFSLT